MTRYHATPDGNIPFTAEEETEWDAREAEYAAQEPERNKAANKAQAEQLLKDTDWVEIPSVSDTANNPHLVNYVEFIAYRLELRAIAVNPPIEIADFPEKPAESWSSV